LERVVLDTNVLVSTLLNSFGVPGRVLDLVLAGELTVTHDDRILASGGRYFAGRNSASRPVISRCCWALSKARESA
jgi:hypothetical protein